MLEQLCYQPVLTPMSEYLLGVSMNSLNYWY